MNVRISQYLVQETISATSRIVFIAQNMPQFVVATEKPIKIKQLWSARITVILKTQRCSLIAKDHVHLSEMIVQILSMIRSAQKLSQNQARLVEKMGRKILI